VTRTLPENLDGSSVRVAIAVARFNTLITERLLSGALEGLDALGVSAERRIVAWVPGSFELPFAAQRLAETQRYDAVICLGCVIKGETDHNEYINQATALALQDVSRETGVPAIFKIITADTLEQALARSGEGTSNWGYEGAQTAVIMANLRRSLAE
jgi:6,7-dimethyl-8-ribityllumazine synthase